MNSGTAVSLKGRCALVTGSVAGLGYAIAEKLSEAGAAVVLNGLATAQEAEAARARLERRFGHPVLFHGADLARVDAIDDMMKTAAAAFGAVDIVVNNAVVRHVAPVEDFGTRQWDDSLAVNLSAAFHTIRLALPGMRQGGWGRIVNVSSVYGLSATINRVGYVTTKTALIGLTRAVALETAATSITCNALCPGTLPTPAILSKIAALAADRGLTEAEATRDYLAERQPSGRFVAMESVGATTVFLCSKAGSDITGAVLPVDGGWTANS
jgi:3-hydroxybutyrate dehydrogenase